MGRCDEGPGGRAAPAADGIVWPLEETKRSGGIRLRFAPVGPKREDTREERAPLPEGWKPNPPAWPPSSLGRERPRTVRLSILERGELKGWMRLVAGGPGGRRMTRRDGMRRSEGAQRGASTR